MADFDKIFQKSNLEESKKKSKMIFGKLLIKLRSGNYIKLYSLLGNVSETDFLENRLMVKLSEKSSYDMINRNDYEIINKLLVDIESGCEVEFSYSNEIRYDAYKFKEYLKNEFGKILTIK